MIEKHGDRKDDIQIVLWRERIIDRRDRLLIKIVSGGVSLAALPLELVLLTESATLVSVN